jgi:acylphosphatase
MSAARFLVSGKVQGVWFRASTREQSLRLKLQGFARNLDNGDVEVVAEGDEAALAELEAWLWRGPPSANVTKVHREPLLPQSPISGFFVH